MRGQPQATHRRRVCAGVLTGVALLLLVLAAASASPPAAQATAVDLCGDARQEIVLYQPYDGRAVFVFTQPDSDGHEKPYVPQPATYNFRTYF